ncbi:MAG: hypothetical protein IJ740_10145 [Ruminococcus sp.]|nr:hypothetical protein [Ruminococcus sp.]
MWNMVRSNEEIEELKENFGGFKNSCICDIRYRSGAYIGTAADHFINDDLSISVIFQRRSMGDVQTFELRFSGIKKLILEPLSKGMECYLTSASIKSDKRGIYFSSWEDFDRINADAGVLLVEADMLMWRDISDVMSYTA